MLGRSQRLTGAILSSKVGCSPSVVVAGLSQERHTCRGSFGGSVVGWTVVSMNTRTNKISESRRRARMRCRTRDTRALGRRCSPSRITVSAATAGSALSVLCLRLVPRLSLTTHCTVSRRLCSTGNKGTNRSTANQSKNFFFLLSYAEKKSKNCAFDSLCYIWGG